MIRIATDASGGSLMVIAHPDEAYLAQVARTRPVHGVVAGTANAAAIAALG